MHKIPKTPEEYEAALARANQLIVSDPEPGTSEADELELLVLVISKYEDEHFPIRNPTPVEAIKFRMEQQELTQRDLVPLLGSRSRVSEILSGKRQLTLKMIRALHESLGIPADVLLQEPGASLPDEVGIDWGRFPIGEMLKRAWFEFDGTAREAKERAEEIMREFFSECGGCGLDHVLLRSHVRQASTMDRYALAAWCARVMQLASSRELATPYKRGVLTSDFLVDLVKLSYFSDGPVLAKEFLERSGVHLILLGHLPRTHLDGAAMLLEDGTPVVALTLRHDRLDSFWFSLLHELAHVAKDLNAEETTRFFDDLDVDGDSLESRADKLAASALIPPRAWGNSTARREGTPAAVRAFAEKHRINSAIVAGRVRYELKDFRTLSKLVGHRQVRKHFPGYAFGEA